MGSPPVNPARYREKLKMNIENALTILGLLGVGGLLGTYFRILWERKNSALLQKQEFKETRYKCIIILGDYKGFCTKFDTILTNFSKIIS